VTRIDPVAQYLKERKVAAHLARLDLDGLVDRWRKTVDEIAEGYGAGLDDYLNDVDLRQILHELERDLPAAWNGAAKARLQAVDRRCRAHLAPSGACLWGRAAADEQGWTARENWWYFRAPRHPGPELARELKLRKSR
jgi:hypothetical protein